MLALEIELLTGVYRAELPDRSGVEWPPHPERVFSALVQAWADGGSDHDQRDALCRLQQLSPPILIADERLEITARDAPIVYVPPNDPRGDEEVALPDRRRRQARRFMAVVPPLNARPDGGPSMPIVEMRWSETVTSEDIDRLNAIASRVACIGHSASLVRCRFVAEAEPVEIAGTWRPDPTGFAALRVPYEGRLEALERWHREGRRPRSGVTIRYAAPGKAAPPELRSVFGGPDDWFVFESEGRSPVDLLACVHVTDKVHKSLLAHAGDPSPEVLSGHRADGTPSRAPHVAIVPLANVGGEHSNGDLLGFAVVLPRAAERGTVERDAVLAALARFAGIVGVDGAMTARLLMGAAGEWIVAHTDAPSRKSLRPARWCRASDEWTSVTPMLLDRFPDRDDPAEEARIIAAASRNIGLPEPDHVEIHKHSAVNGAPSAYPARGDRRRPDWSFPAGSKFAGRLRRHVVLRFAEPVQGPVILGAGRFRGMGLCLPLRQAQEGMRETDR